MSVTEDTVTDLVAGYLRQHGVNALTQISNTASGRRNQPDIEIKNGGLFFGEAKWESKKWEGFGEARDYGEEIAGTEGTFLIAYPDEIKSKGIQTSFEGDLAESSLGEYEYSVAFLRRDQPTDMRKVSLQELPEWIQQNIKEKRAPETDTDEVVDVLRQMARRLNNELETAPEDNLFRNVLGASTDDEDEREAARETAGFLLINQITFYRVLSYYIDEFDVIDPDTLNEPSDLSHYFQQVLEVDYTPVYQFKIVEDLPKSAMSVVQDTVKSVNGLSPENINHDVLGKVFHELIPHEARKKVAAYYTKNQAADILTDLAIESPEDRVMDPACGSGTLLASSYQQKRELFEGRFTETDHRRFIEEDLTGIDVMPFAAHLSCIHLALQAPVYETDEVNIGIADSTGLNPGDTINPLSFVLPEPEQQRGLGDYADGARPDLEQEGVEGGSITLDADKGQEMLLQHSDVVIMNPPFSRQESVARFSPDYKGKLETRFSRREKQIHGKMSYCSYFFFLADKFLKKGGRMAVVCPATVLNKESDQGVREMLIQEYNVEYIFAREDAPNYSEDTDLREVLIIARKGFDESEDNSTAFVSHDGLNIDASDVKETAETTAAGETTYADDYTVQRISLEDLNINNLFAPFSVGNPELFDSWEKVANGLSLTTLDSLDVGRIRGIGSNADGVMHVHPICSLNDPNAYKFGDEDLFVLQEEFDDHVTAQHRFTDETFDIPRDHVVPNLRRYSGRQTVDLSGIPEYVILDDKWDGGDRYISLTDEPRIHPKWSERVQKRRGHIALVRRVDLTAPGTHHMAYYSDEKRLYPDMMWVLPDANQKEAKILTAWFDSTFGWLQSIFDRIETRGGWIEWHGYIVDKYRVPLLSSFANDDDQRQELINTFDAVKQEEAPSMVRQLALNASEEYFTDDQIDAMDDAFENISDDLGEGFGERRELDKAILTIADIEGKNQEQFLDKFYSDLLTEIVALKLMMD
ncbi:class I SAM-dependent DNA methyltransferase [Haloferax sp. YSMS24]|uniref:HsdM family class I SAM-dependent methyltransferase n=1 Tax=Haloferax sp. YSMS24 TaxID=3388425 RepID=UPI00398C869B